MPSVTRLSLVFLFLFLAPPEVVTGKGKSPRCRTPQVQGGGWRHRGGFSVFTCTLSGEFGGGQVRGLYQVHLQEAHQKRCNLGSEPSYVSHSRELYNKEIFVDFSDICCVVNGTLYQAGSSIGVVQVQGAGHGQELSCVQVIRRSSS